MSKSKQSQSESPRDEDLAKVEDSEAISLRSPSDAQPGPAVHSSDYEAGFQAGYKAGQHDLDRETAYVRNGIVQGVINGLRFTVTKEEEPSSTAERITRVAEEIIQKCEARGLVAKWKPGGNAPE